MRPGALGIDIGGTKLAAGVIDSGGRLISKHVVQTPPRPREILDAALGVADAVRKQALLAGVEPVVVGVGASGHIDHDRGVVSHGSGIMPGWMGTDVAGPLRDGLGLAVTVDNDVNAMALGEHRFGAGKEYADVLYVTVGTGVGGALILGNELRRGVHWSAGEVAHLVVDITGRRICNCGTPGHLEAYAAGPAMMEHYHELSGREVCDLREVARLASNGDSLEIGVLAEGARVLGLALGGLLSVLDPEALVIGGGVPQIGELWRSPFEAELRASPMPGPRDVDLHYAKLGTDAGIVGAAYLALSELASEVLGG